MASTTLFAFFKPDVLETTGYAYGKTTSDGQRGRVDVERVASGRWADVEPFTTQREVAEVEMRAVTEEKALSGIGTYVGSALCIARVPQGQPKVWDYGVVVGYTWNKTSKTGVLQVTFADGTGELPYGKEEQQDLALETYALRPCNRRGVADIMPAEMRAIHNAVHDHFNGIGQPARRSSATVLRKVGMTKVDESQIIPVFNVADNRVDNLRIDHILNYIFYNEGKRRPPQGVTVPLSLFTGTTKTTDVAPERPDNTGTEVERLEQLYDSGDDLDETGVDQGESTQAVGLKRARGAPGVRGEPRLGAMRQRLEDDPEMVRDIDQLIALRQANLGSSNTTALVSAGGPETKAQFKPSRQQVVAHGLLVNGKYAALDSQLFVETMQSKSKEFDYLPHPGAAQGFFGWDFGFRGLSSMHFSPMDVDEEREFRRRHDMTDFSVKNKLPNPPKAMIIADILASLEVLSLLVNEMYQPMVMDLVDSARRFLLAPWKTKSMSGPEAVPELVAWIDDCFEQFRSCLVRQDLTAAVEVKKSFQFNNESYARVVHRVTNLRVEAATKAPPGEPSLDTREVSAGRKATTNHQPCLFPRQ